MCKCNFSRLLALIMSVAMLFALAVPASAESDALSAELLLETEGLELSGKIALSPSEQALLLGAQLLLSGEDYGSIFVTASENAVTLRSGFLDQVYGLAVPTLAENLENSIFAPNSGSSFALDEESYELIRSALSGEMMEQAQSASDALMQSAEELTAMMEPLVSMVGTLVEEAQHYLIYQTRKTNVTVNGRTFPATQATVAADGESLTGICNAVLDLIEADEQVQSSIAALIDLFNTEDDTVTGEEYVSAILEAIPELREELAEMIENSELEIALSATVLDDEASTPVKLELKITEDDYPVTLALLMNPEMDFFRLEAAGYITYALELTMDYSDVVTFRLDALEDEELHSRYQLSFDDSVYMLAFTELYHYYDSDTEKWYRGQNSSTLAGTYALTDNLFTLTLTEVDGEDLGGTVTLNLRNNDSFTVPAFVEITTLSEGELAVVIQDLMTGVQTLEALFED